MGVRGLGLHLSMLCRGSVHVHRWGQAASACVSTWGVGVGRRQLWLQVPLHESEAAQCGCAHRGVLPCTPSTRAAAVVAPVILGSQLLAAVSVKERVDISNALALPSIPQNLSQAPQWGKGSFWEKRCWT